MAAPDRGRALPKFGEWDVNNPASAEGFTIIFNKARDEKKTSGTGTGTATNAVYPRRTDSTCNNKKEKVQYPPKSKKRWFCCGFVQFQRVDGTSGMV